jgi:hypothetical protein
MDESSLKIGSRQPVLSTSPAHSASATPNSCLALENTSTQTQALEPTTTTKKERPWYQYLKIDQVTQIEPIKRFLGMRIEKVLEWMKVH